MTKIRAAASVGLFLFVAYAAASVGYAQVIPRQALDASGAPQYRAEPFWPKPLPNRWSMQQIVGISVDSMDHVWYLNRGTSALPIELTAEGGRFLAKTLQISAETLSHPRRPVCKACLDWSERRHHLAGTLGAAIMTRFTELKWAARDATPGSRVINFSRNGEKRFEALFGDHE